MRMSNITYMQKTTEKSVVFWSYEKSKRAAEACSLSKLTNRRYAFKK